MLFSVVYVVFCCSRFSVVHVVFCCSFQVCGASPLQVNGSLPRTVIVGVSSFIQLAICVCVCFYCLLTLRKKKKKHIKQQLPASYFHRRPLMMSLLLFHLVNSFAPITGLTEIQRWGGWGLIVCSPLYICRSPHVSLVIYQMCSYCLFVEYHKGHSLNLSSCT